MFIATVQFAGFRPNEQAGICDSSERHSEPRDVILDVLHSPDFQQRTVAYLHYTYLWPLCTRELQRLAKTSKRIVLVEQNYPGQLGMLTRVACGLEITDKILKYDGRPFFYDELLSQLLEQFAADLSGQGAVAARLTAKNNSENPKVAGL
jgi:hypothetical protein